MAWQGFVLVLCGAFFLAVYQLVNKKLLTNGAPADCVSTANFLGSGTLLFVASFLFDPPEIGSWFDFPQGLFWPLAATSLLNIVILFGGVRALSYGDLSLIAPVSAAQPMIVLIPSWFILGEAPDAWGYTGLLLLAVGMYIFSFAEEVYLLDPVTGEKKPWQPPRYLTWMGRVARYYAPVQMLFRNKGVRIAFLVAVCGAVAINFDKLAILRSSVTFFEASVLVFCGIIGLAKTLGSKEWNKMRASHARHLIATAILFAVVAVLFGSAFYFGFAAYIGALKRTSVVFALILGWVLLKEQNVKKRWPGALIMTAGAALLSL